MSVKIRYRTLPHLDVELPTVSLTVHLHLHDPQDVEPAKLRELAAIIAARRRQRPGGNCN